MRLEKAAGILKLAHALAGSAHGLTIDEMAQEAAVSRRTAERMRDAVEFVFGPLEPVEDGRKRRFRIAARGLGNFAVAPTADELTELENAARACEAARDDGRAKTLRALAHKIRASLREADRRRLDTDVEAQVRAEAFARQVGPRPLANPAVLGILREALLAGRKVKFRYGEEHCDDASPQREMIPYGILFGPRYYLVANTRAMLEPAIFRLDRIHDAEVGDEPGAPPPEFNLTDYAARSFGVFQEEPEEIELRFAQSSAADAQSYLFHPTQSMTLAKNGSLTVRFRAAGLLQIVHHLMTWGPAVTIMKSRRLKQLMLREVDALHAHVCCRQNRFETPT